MMEQAKIEDKMEVTSIMIWFLIEGNVHTSLGIEETKEKTCKTATRVV